VNGRDLLRAGLVALVVLSTITAYDRIFQSPDWRLPALAAALAALVIAVVVRGVGGGGFIAAIASAVGFTALIPVLAGIVARPSLPDATLRADVLDRISQGVLELEITPAPAPLLAGIALLLVAGFWVVTHIAHELLVRWSQTGAALVVLAVLWAVPLVVPVSDTSWQLRAVPFIAAGGLTLLLTTEHRLPRPGLATAGVGMAALAIATAATAPGLLPGFQNDAWYGLGAGSSAPRGYQPIVDVSTRLQQPEEREVLRVRSSQRTYLRLAGLDTFDGFTWRLGPASEGSYRPDPSTLFPTQDLLPPEVPAQATEPVFVDVEVLDLANIYVPVPYQPVQVLGPFRDEMVWSTDGGFLATWDIEDGQLAEDGPRVGVREGFTYRVQAERPVPTREQLLDSQVDEATLARFTQLPRDYPELAALAEQIYADADATSTIDRALALQEWFTGPGGDFTYDLDVPALRGDDALERFIIEDRVGYCEYFAAGMATMLRATGIPARVATGFLPGDAIGAPDDDSELTEYSVTSADAHAWVEVLFPGFGWITFEPTPRSDGTQIQPRADELSPLENERERRARELAEQADSLEDTPVPDTPDLDGPELPDEFETDDASEFEGAAGGESNGSTRTIVVVLTALAALAGGAALVLRRRGVERSDHDARHRILAEQQRVYAAAARYGVARRPNETSVELAHRWHREHRVGRDAERFAHITQAAAFGGHVDGPLADEARQLATELIAELRASVDSTTRRTAVLRGPWLRATKRGRELVGSGADRP
jgi:transglutaminase-like putative cysteine protease